MLEDQVAGVERLCPGFDVGGVDADNRVQGGNGDFIVTLFSIASREGNGVSDAFFRGLAAAAVLVK